ncbi:MAG: GT4 family glycosyltransferase PelF, partial [Rothia sp. (in: high G+C Gram-positive bacteria)]|nr:GT4 family glycosyltransferase PelF [Rothia sp. (in: high G+C Gram-positive bacteria)]
MNNIYQDLKLPEVTVKYSDPKYPDVDVAIVMESTYPFLKGGVSAVVHDIITSNPDLTYGIIHIAWDSDSPSEDLYGMPKNVLWVKTIFLSLEEHRAGFNVPSRELKMTSTQKIAASDQILDALFALHNQADVNPLWEVYDRFFSERTRTHPGWALLGTKEFMHQFFTRMPLGDLSFADAFWLIRTFFSLVYALLHERMPYARVYHAHTTGYASLLGAAAARDNGTSFFLTEHNLYVRDTVNTLLDRNMSYPVVVGDENVLAETAEQRAWVLWWIQMGRFCYPSADRITYLYPKAIEEARGLHGLEERSVILPNGMLISDVNEAYSLRRAARQQIELQGTNHHWKFVFIARVVPIKGLLDLIETVGILKNEGYTLHIDCLGPTEHVPWYYDECREAIAKRGLEDYFTFHGTVNVREKLGEYDALVMPSYNEGQPIVALEAMSASIPVIGSDVGGMSQLIDDTLVADDGTMVERCGILTQPADPEGFAVALKRVMNNPAYYEQLCLNARERVVQFFQLHSVMERYNMLYRELGKLPPKPEHAGMSIDAVRSIP